MQHTSKRFLLSSDQIRNLKRKSDQDSTDKISHPYKTSAKKAKRELKTGLNNPFLSEINKVINYSQNFNKYLKNLKSAVTLSKRQALFGKENNSSTSDQPENLNFITEEGTPPPSPHSSADSETFSFADVYTTTN